MDTFIHADIFFFITTIAVVLLTICLLIGAFYVIRILRNIKRLSETVKSEGEALADDLREFRSSMRQEGLKAKTIANFFLALLLPKGRARTITQRKKHDTEKND